MPTKFIKDGDERKTSLKTDNGETVTFEIEQPVQRYGYVGTGYLRYSNFSFTDVLPEGLDYVSARVIRRMDGSDTDVTDKGVLSYGNLTQTVSFSFDTSYLTNASGSYDNRMAYVGESYVLEIKAIVRKNGVTNKAYTTICNTRQDTDEVTITCPYIVKYDKNGSVNPDHQTGEFVNNTVTGSMADSLFDFDTEYNLRTNAYKREGYEFVGWNTKSDGTGVDYEDGEAVTNLVPYNDAEITLYAQWRKKLGTETITVISEETGNPVSHVEMKLQKKVNGVWTDVTSGTTSNNGEITVNDLHWFDYRWVMTDVPAGYVKSSDTVFTITYNQLSATNQVILYMKRVSIVLDSRVSDIIHGEAAPSFMYMISGTDVAGVQHSYNLMVQTSGSSKFGTNRLDDLFAGTYKVTQIPVSRYVAENAQNVRNSTPDGVNAGVDVVSNDIAEVLFPYGITQYGGFSHTDGVTNKLEK